MIHSSLAEQQTLNMGAICWTVVASCWILIQLLLSTQLCILAWTLTDMAGGWKYVVVNVIGQFRYELFFNVPFEYFNYGPTVLDLFAKPHDTKLENNWLTSFNKQQLAKHNRPRLHSVQQCSTVVQYVEWHTSTFNNTILCSTFVEHICC